MRTVDEIVAERQRLQTKVRTTRLAKAARDDLWARIETLAWVLWSIEGEECE